MWKRLCSGALACALLSCPTAAGAVEAGQPVSAASAILVDGSSGRVLYEKDAHQKRLIASTTKLMTALVALESGHRLDEVVTIAPEWTGAEGSSLYLRPGEEITLEALLYGLLLRSGNDAALAVAGHCGGTVEDFVTLMNRKARELGMEQSAFANPNGLNAEGHYSTAYDMALLARACLRNQALVEIASTKSITFGTRSFTNHNKLLWQYEGCIGLKTGYTEKAGRTLVSAAERDGLTLICVTLNAPNDWVDHAKLFDYGFSQFTPEVVSEAGKPLGRLPVAGSLLPVCPVAAGEGFSVALAPGEELEVSRVLNDRPLPAPVERGMRVGELVCSLQGCELARIPLVTAVKIPENKASQGNFLDRLWRGLAG